MKHRKHSYQHVLAVTVCVISATLFQSRALGAPGSLSDQPLYVGPAVESNIFMLSDDSGSMDWEVMTTDTDNGGRFTGSQPDGSNPVGAGDVKHRDSNDDGSANCSFSDSYSSDGYIYIVEWGSNAYSDNGNDCYTADDQAWRIRNSDFNPLYFDPTKTYEPWDGKDINGNPFDNIDITNAPDDPYNPQETINLLTDNSNWAGAGLARLTSDRDGDGNPDGFYFYTWTDDGDGIFENGEETEYKIRDITDAQAVTWLGEGKTAADVKQNFANWFGYHRKREFVAKYALSKAIVDLTGARVGYGSINNNNNVKIEVASLNLEPDVGNKKALFDKLYSTNSSGGTPLRQNLRNVGRYFDYVNNSFFGDTGDYTNPILPAGEYGMCQKNVSILMTDGFYTGSSPSIGNADGDGDTAFDGGAYSDTYSNTLADVAMHYYENDLSALSNEVPTSASDSASHQHMNTITVAFGVSGTLNPATDDPTAGGFSWPDPDDGNDEKIDDLWHAAYNGRGDFFSAQNPDSLVTAIQAAVNTASKGTSTAAAVAFNTTTLDTGSVVYQAKFNPSENWKGELISSDLAGDGSIAESPTWNAGNVLNTQSHASRVILTYKRDTGTPGNSTGIAFKTLANLASSQQDDLNMGPSGADGEGQARIDYLRGDTSDESQDLFFRDRTNVLGDIVHSNPVYVGKPQSGYPNTATFGDGVYSDFVAANEDRGGIIYVGANDGMLHGFNEDDGSEAMAFIPNALFSSSAGEGLHYLTDPSYSHRYYVDLSPTVQDVYIDGAWKTVLVGGLRAGGRGIFALDITDPSSFADANAGDIVMWEFDSSDDADLGYTFSQPTITLLENGKWAAIFGNGYNSTGDGQASLFILYLEDGMDGEWSNGDYIEIKTGVGTLADKNGLSSSAVVDADGDGRADRVYAGDLEGNLWAFDISGSNPSQWGVAYKQGNTPKPLFIAANSGGTAQAITTKPIVATQTASVSGNPDPSLMVFFGTGQFIVDGDKTTSDTQSFYGVWDSGTKELTRSDLTQQTLTASGSVRTTSDNVVAYSNSNHGWFHDLPTSGERVVVNPKIRGEFVFYNTLIPGTQLCQPDGYGWLMAVKQVDGTMSDTALFDTDGDGDVDGDDAQAAGVQLTDIPAGSNFLGDMMYTPDDEGNIDARRVDVGISGDSGRLSWQELFAQ